MIWFQVLRMLLPGLQGSKWRIFCELRREVSVFILTAIMGLTVVDCSTTTSMNIFPPLEQWAWMSGANGINQSGLYGSEGKTVAGNVPGSRQGAVSWTNPAGNLWLFGEVGIYSTGTQGELNDLWVYSRGQWAWDERGECCQSTWYIWDRGDRGCHQCAWSAYRRHQLDRSGRKSVALRWCRSRRECSYGFLNDLWVYSRGEWTWINGANEANQAGTYGTEGTPAASNVPGARQGAISWMDAAGNLWLFGGMDVDDN
jgi:hypothetical protein